MSNKSKRAVPTLVAVGIILVSMLSMITGCSDEKTIVHRRVNNSQPAVEEVKIAGYQIDAQAFRDEGEFGMGLLILDALGEAILDETVRVSIAVNSSDYSAGLVDLENHSGSSLPLVSTVLIDDSGSMEYSDGSFMRRDATRMYWETVLPRNGENLVAVLDFGAGSSSGFSQTRLLQNWTNDTDSLEGALSYIVADGTTPLYQSSIEVLEFTNGNHDPLAVKRSLLVLTDGQPDDEGQAPDAYTDALAYNIPINTVGLGPASELGGNPDTTAIRHARNLATYTGGIYASATDAEALVPIFETMASVSAQGQILATFQLSGSIPAAGEMVTGTVTVFSGGSAETASFSFMAP